MISLRRTLERLLLVSAFVLSFTSIAEASHFRFAHNTWKRISDNSDGSVTVEFTSLQAWRTTGLDMLGLDFGDGNSYFPSFSDITDVFAGTDLAGEGYTIRRFVVQHTYAAVDIASNSGQFLVVAESCCRIGSLVNAGDGDERIETRVDLNGNNQGSAVSNIPVILQLSVGQNNSLALGAADPDGDPVTCRMATSAESDIFSVASAGGNDVTVSPSCVLSWDLTGTDVSNVSEKYAVQIVIEESNRCSGQSCGSVALDFIIELVQGNPPSCSSDKPVNNTLYVGVPFTANFTGTDSDPGALLTVTSFGAPAGATLTPASGTQQAAPFGANLAWTPQESDRGSAQSVLVTYQDETGLQGVCSISLQVSVSDPVVTCNQVDIAASQFAMDGNALAQKGVADNAARRFLALGGSKKQYRSFRTEAEKLYIQAWTQTWAIPSKLLDCGASEFCGTVSTADYTSGYLATISQLDALTKSIISKIQKQSRGRKAKSLRRANTRSFSQSMAAVAGVPATESSCPGAHVHIAGEEHSNHEA